MANRGAVSNAVRLAAMTDRTGEITALLNLAKDEAITGDRLWALVYPELRRRAGAIVSGERSDHTLSATAVISETYVRLSTRSPAEWTDRTHFYAVASAIMRHVLIDHARARAASKRGGGAHKLPLDEGIFANVDDDEAGVRAAGEALEQLAADHERAALVVSLRVFGGLTVAEIAREVGISERSVGNDWTLAREKLRDLLRNDD
jgi:RNA polymerase sigma-70 factor (ECF subfamily)